MALAKGESSAPGGDISFEDIEIILDISRLLSRVAHPTPTGVDRCEMAYARGLLHAVPRNLSFAAVHPTGIYGRLPREAAIRFLDETENRWAERGYGSSAERRRFALRSLGALWPRAQSPRRAVRGRFYVQASHHNLTRPKLISRILARENARMICLVHDLIPLLYPEYARVDGAELHRRRVRTIAAHASGIVANSHATLASLMPWLHDAGSTAQTAVAHLGTHVAASDGPASAPEAPYFVCIGTIEPRKNHLLLLHLWRKMAEERGALSIPRLLVIGRRGWENEQVVDLLERCPSLSNCIEELPGLSDREVHARLRGARALLMPSFAEGYGMPVVEALQAGVPVICSDLPALREAGGAVPEFIDPLDGAAWLAAIDRYAQPSAAIAQRARMADWHAPTWEQHMAILLRMVQGLLS